VAAGEYAVGMTLEYAAQEYVAGGQKEIKLVYPTEGSYLAPEGMFIIKGAKNMDAAKALYDGLLSKESQEAQLVKNFRRPTRTDVAVASLTTLPDLKTIKIFPVSQDAAAKEYEAVVAAWNQAVAKSK
jgi:iron(III) transport system substrate-binding protein